MKFLGIIPSRFGSMRLPGKPLLNIKGKPMIQRVYEQCTQSKLLDKVIVATDCNYIYNAIQNINGNVVMTAISHENGTKRCIEVIKQLDEEFDYIINIQGDEPFIQPEQIDELCTIALKNDINIATQIKKEFNIDYNQNKNIVKCIVDKKNNAINFTRNEILLNDNYFYKHIGMYLFKKETLLNIEKLNPTSNEIKENLEQLRWLDNGINIYAQETNYSSKSIDTFDDLD